MKNFNIFIPITKIDETKRLVYGLATAEQVDKSGEIFDYDSSVPFYKEWSGEIEKASGGKSLGNVREMHTNIAAGKITQMIFNDDLKQIEVCAKIVNDSTWEKVAEGVLTGFSHGGEYIKTWKDPSNNKHTRYTAKPSELSVVDNPCLGTATFIAVKADGSTEMRKFKIKETPVNKTVDASGKPVQPKHTAMQKWEASDGKTFEKKEDWRLYQLSLETDTAIDPALAALDALSKALDDKEPVDPQTLNKKEFSDDKRKELADSGKAMPDGSFPIENVQDLKNAVRAHGRAADPEKAKAHIISRAKELGATAELPDAWKDKKEDTMKIKLPDMKKFCDEAWDASRAIEALQIIASLICGEEFEALMGEDEAGQVSDLKAACSSLKSFIAAEIMENEDEGMELPMEMSDKIKDLAKAAITSDAINEKFVEQFDELLKTLKISKAGARHSGEDKKQLGKAKDGLEEAKGHMEDAHDSHEKIGKSMGAMRDTMDKMAGCMKTVIATLKKADDKGEDAGKMSDHMDEMDSHMSKAEKHHGKLGKSHDGIDAAHDVVGHALKAVGAEADDNKKDDEAEKAVTAQLTKATEELELLKKNNSELETANTEMKKTLDKVTADMPAMIERLKKLESQPMPGKGALFAPEHGKDGLLYKGHEAKDPAAKPVETRVASTYGASPEQMRAIMNIK